MTPEEQLELDLQVERDIRAAKQARAAEQAASQAAARSVAMGGPFPTPEEQLRLDFETLREAQRKQELALRGLPPFMPPLEDKEDVQRILAERERISTPGGGAEAPYTEAREGFFPFLRPTRIEEVPLPAPMVGTQRVIREGFAPPLLEPVTRAPTGTEEFIEAYARQPVLTREAAKQLAAGAPPEAVQRKVGELGGAVVETPFQAAMRGLAVSGPAAVTELYRMIPRASDEPITITGAGGLQEALGQLGDIAGRLSPTAAKYLYRAAEEVVKPEQAVKRGAVSAVRGVTGALERVAGLEPGTSPLGQELATLGTLQPVIPSPTVVKDKPLAERIRQGEGFAAVIQSDPRSVEVYDREFGVLAPFAPEVTGFLLELPIPLTPIGLVGKAGKLLGAGAKFEKGLTRAAVKQADNMLANRIYTDVMGAKYEGTARLTLDNLEPALRQTMRQPFPVSGNIPPTEADFVHKIPAMISKAKDDLARVAPRTDLVRVSPSYAVPAALAPKVTREAAADVARLRTQAQARGRTLTRAEEVAARDTAAIRAAQSEAKRLDELGQFQVLLDGLDTPRAWDTTLFRAAKAAAAPEQAMKRAAVVAAEQEVARQGQNALRLFRKEVEARSKQGESLDTILSAIGRRELAGMGDDPAAEVAKKVLEEAYGGERAPILFNRIADDPTYTTIDLLTPTRARELHALFVAEGLVPPASKFLTPNFAANAVKIIMEEGVRKRVSKQLRAEFMARYPDLKAPTLAVPKKNSSPDGKVVPAMFGPEGQKAAAALEERKFFENGAEDLFRLADTIPTRAAGLNLDVAQGAERLAAAARNVRTKARIPIVAEAQLLAGERLAAPVRAFLTTRYGLPAGADLAGVNTPYGYLRPKDLDDLVDGLGGFGPSRMDIARKGSMVQDILLSAAKGIGPTAKDVAMGRPMAYATADAIEEGFRRGVFVRALQEGRTPEAAIELARRSQLDYGSAQDTAIIQALAPYFASLVNTSAAGREFIDQMAKNPKAYTTYLRALQEQQRVADPTGEQGDLPLTRFYAPIPEGATRDMLGRPLDMLGPNAPLLQPVQWPITAFKALTTSGELVAMVMDEGFMELVEAGLGGSAEALDSLAERAASLSAGFAGEGAEPTGPKTVKRTPSIDQTYLAALALARAYDPDRSSGVQDAALRFLQPDWATPPKDKAAFGYEGNKAWSVRPPTGKDAFIFEEQVDRVSGDPSAGKVTVYYLGKPSKVGRQRLQTLEALPLSDIVFDPARAIGTGFAEGPGEGVLWAIGAETVEEPTKQVIEQTRPR